MSINWHFIFNDMKFISLKVKCKAHTEVDTWNRPSQIVGKMFKFHLMHSAFCEWIYVYTIYQGYGCVCVSVCFNQSQYYILFNSTHVDRRSSNGICCECETCDFSFVTFFIDDKMLQFIFVFVLVCSVQVFMQCEPKFVKCLATKNDVEKLKYLNAVCGVCVCVSSTPSSCSFSLHILRRSR